MDIEPPIGPTEPPLDGATPNAPTTNAPRELDELRAQCDALISTDEVDKKNALAIMSLFHSATTMILNERHERAQEIARMAHELELLRLSCRNADVMEASTKDIAALQQQGRAHAHELVETTAAITKLQHQLDALPRRK